jgi:probable F420-dependent oxidoreductase
MFGHAGNLEPLVQLTAAAAVTKRLRLGTNILLLPLREPALVAKQVATIDVLSGGRFVCGVGLGGEMEHEWAAMEVPLVRRGKRLDEYLDILRALWSGEVMDHAGEFRNISGVVGSPSPFTRGGPPLWVGGRSDAALARALRFDGWTSYATSPRTLAQTVEKLRPGTRPGFTVASTIFVHVADDEATALQNANAVLEPTYNQDMTDLLPHIGAVGDAEQVACRLESFTRAGADELILCVLAPADQIPNQIENLSEILGLTSRAVHHTQTSALTAARLEESYARAEPS